MKRKFLQRDSNRKKRLKDVWRKPKGRDNKMRLKRRGYPSVVSIGYRKSKEDRGKIKGKVPVRINNLEELENVGKENILIIGKVGKRKRAEIIKKAKEKKLEIYNESKK